MAGTGPGHPLPLPWTEYQLHSEYLLSAYCLPINGIRDLYGLPQQTSISLSSLKEL